MLEQTDLARLSFEACHAAMIWIRADGGFSHCNDAAAQALGVSSEELLMMSFQDVAPAFDVTQFQLLWQRLINENPLCLEIELCSKSAAAIPAEVLFDRIQFGGETLVLAIVIDYSDRGQRERALSHSESIQRSIMESSLDCIMLLDRDERIIFINRTAPDLSIEQVIGTPISDYVAEKFHPRMRASFKRVFQTGQPDGYQVDYVSSAGDVSTWEARVAPVYTDDQVTGLTVIARDVTQRNRALTALSKSERSLAQAQQIARMGSWEVDLATGRPSGSAELFRILGLNPKEKFPTLDSFIAQWIHPDDRENVSNSFHKLLTAGVIDAQEFRVVRQPDQQSCYILAEAELLANENGLPQKIIGTFQDISERKLTEEKLREMEAQLAHVTRLTTMGEMVAGIAHEINQPLSAIANFSKACSKRLEMCEPDVEEPLLNWLQQINEQAIRCGDIIRRMRHFAQKTHGDRRVIDLNQVIRDSISLIKSDVRNTNVHFRTHLPEQSLQVCGNHVELQQVLTNLLQNACEATRGCDRPEIDIQLREQDGVARLEIVDNGLGVKEAEVRSLFDAFFTTKPDGMGMGLAISKSIVEAHHGALGYEPHKPQGARFLIDLPLSVAGKEATA